MLPSAVGVGSVLASGADGNTAENLPSLDSNGTPAAAGGVSGALAASPAGASVAGLAAASPAAAPALPASPAAAPAPAPAPSPAGFAASPVVADSFLHPIDSAPTI